MDPLLCQCTAVMVESPLSSCDSGNHSTRIPQCCQPQQQQQVSSAHSIISCDRKVEIAPGAIQLTNLNEIDFMWKQENICDFRCKRCGTVFRLELSSGNPKSRTGPNRSNQSRSCSFNSTNLNGHEENNDNCISNLLTSENNNSTIIAANKKKATLQIIKKGHKILSCKNLNTAQQPSLARAVPLPIREFFVVKKAHMSVSSSLISLAIKDDAEPVSLSPLSDWSNDTDFDMMFSVKRLDLVGSFNPISYMIETF